MLNIIMILLLAQLDYMKNMNIDIKNVPIIIKYIVHGMQKEVLKKAVIIILYLK